jgi:hypothetical protein
MCQGFQFTSFPAFFLAFVCELFRQLNPEELRMEFPLLVSFQLSNVEENGKIAHPIERA